jgi:MoxR-like ATPase
MTEAVYEYRKTFDPKHVEDCRTAADDEEPADLRRDPVYVFSEEIVLAVNVALATRRPILVRGESGTGKSTLARIVAKVLGWRYYERVVTSRTQARDLLWEIDLLRRLHDAYIGKLGDDYEPYVVPGVLWWAFDPHRAEWKGGDPVEGAEPPLTDPSGVKHERAVVLLDEIDKADPDVPNNLLVPLGSLAFEVEETRVAVATTRERAPLVMITTNEERELPRAFLRRCVELVLAMPTRERLVEIARAHFKGEAVAPRTKTSKKTTVRELIDAIVLALFGPEEKGREDEPLGVSPAELLDTVRACLRLGVTPGTPAWTALSGSTVWKFGRRAPEDAGSG